MITRMRLEYISSRMIRKLLECLFYKQMRIFVEYLSRLIRGLWLSLRFSYIDFFV